MQGMIYLSDYQSDDGKRSAKVFRRLELNDYMVVGYVNGMETIGVPFLSEDKADDYAEDWVLGIYNH